LILQIQFAHHGTTRQIPGEPFTFTVHGQPECHRRGALQVKDLKDLFCSIQPEELQDLIQDFQFRDLILYEILLLFYTHSLRIQS
jgi:hypothetical protein